MISETKRVAFCGTRGIPASYGGFETAVDEISLRLQNKDFQCDVFCRSMEVKEDEFFNNRRAIYIKGSKNKKLDTFISSFNTGLFLIRNRKKYDYVFWFNNANLPGIILTKLAGIPMAVNTDGLEWRRAKWSWPFKAYYFLSSLIVCLLCKNLISDSVGIQEYYRKIFKKSTTMIPYGAPEKLTINKERENEILNHFGLEKDRYLLQITRFEPDNLPLNIITAFTRSQAQKEGYKFVLVGYKDENDYSIRIMSQNNKNGIIVLNAIYNKEFLQVLRGNSFCYIHGNSVGGTNPALLEAMTNSKRILAVDIIFSREVLGEYGNYFSPAEIEGEINEILNTKPAQDELLRRVRQHYDWDKVSIRYREMSTRTRVGGNISTKHELEL